MSTNIITWNNQCPDGISTCSRDSYGGASTYTTELAIKTIPTTSPTTEYQTFVGWNTAADGSGTSVDGTYTPSSPYGAITFYAQWAAKAVCNNSGVRISGGVGACQVGDIGPGGGIVIYVSTISFNEVGATCAPTCHYLEVAPASTSATNHWVDITAPWSGTYESIGTSTAIGSGYANTLAMINQSGAGTAGAASLARAYRGPNNLSDWFLPSRDELVEGGANHARVIMNFTELGAAKYWTSSQSANKSSDAWYEYILADFTQDNASKDQTLFVRPIRAF